MMNLFPFGKIQEWSGVILVVGLVAMSGCFPQSVPLAILPMEEPEAAALNLKGIDQYHIGEWEASLELFQSALRVNPLLVEVHYNAALALHQLGRHQEARQHFQQAGKLDPDNRSIIHSTLYRNHLGLSSTLERHLSGGYRYQGEE